MFTCYHMRELYMDSVELVVYSSTFIITQCKKMQEASLQKDVRTRYLELQTQIQEHFSNPKALLSVSC